MDQISKMSAGCIKTIYTNKLMPYTYTYTYTHTHIYNCVLVMRIS